MQVLRKYAVMKMLNAFQKLGCKTIDDIKSLLNRELKHDTDIVFRWRTFR